VNGDRLPPFPKGKGICEGCGAETQAKCGDVKMWHWAHRSKMECDPWWENETEWHRRWKEQFPESFREIVHTCEVTGEKHRADIKTSHNVVVEVQNSPISLEELHSREQFYKNMVWIVNAEKFLKRFRVLGNNRLPDPSVTELHDIMFFHSNNEHSCTMYWSKAENPDARTGRDLVRVRDTQEIEGQLRPHYVGHHPFIWKNPHIAWMEAKCPVFLDFGSDVLWRFEKYRSQFMCVRAVAKHKVIADITNRAQCQLIGLGHSILKD
jgi:hypothetical protein